MKDGRTDLGHKSELMIDLETQALVAIQVCGADDGDTALLPWSLLQASMNLEASFLDEEVSKAEEPLPLLSEVVTDKGYHSNQSAKMLKTAQIRSYLSEPDRGVVSRRRILKLRRLSMLIGDAYEGLVAKPFNVFAPSIPNAVSPICIEPEACAARTFGVRRRSPKGYVFMLAPSILVW